MTNNNNGCFDIILQLFVNSAGGAIGNVIAAIILCAMAILIYRYMGVDINNPTANIIPLSTNVVIPTHTPTLSETEVTQPVSNEPPSISILSPSNNATALVNEQILVSVQATHPIGVTRVQLFANGQPVKTISSEFINGDPTFEGVLDFTPRVEGAYTLRVLAFHDAISSNPVDITVMVGGEESTSTLQSNGLVIPEIPNDGLCRVLVLVGLNFREEPTTENQNVITTLPSGTLLLVVARLGDNSWWKVNYNNHIGWVGGNQQYTSLYGNCGSIPVESYSSTSRATATSGMPDLIVPTVSTLDVIPSGSSEVIVEFGITVKNQGTGPSGQFSVSLRVGADTYDVAVVGNLLPNEIITLTQDVRFTAAGDYDIRVDADPSNQVRESIEVNNRADVTVTVSNQ